MKKVFLASMALLLSSSAFSAPKVGDSTYMEGTSVEDGVSKKITATQTILAFAPSTGMYTVRQIQTVGGLSESRDVSVAADDILSEETATEIVAQCESNGLGKNEKIEVKAGKFNTCKLKNESDSVLWLAPVPFGIVRFKTTAASAVLEMQLHSYTRGN